ncbi:MAG: prepilin peptidase [Candidatus Zixiibacteriota bacterium]
MPDFELILVFVLGLAVGSFLNVLVYRLPRRKQFVKGRSACPHCGAVIKWYQNIPLVSYLALRGRCASCHKPISWRYPLIELLNGLGYLYFFYNYNWSVEFAVFAFLASALIVVFFIDLEHQIIPDLVTLPGMVIGLAVSLFPDGVTIVQSLIGLVVGGGALYLIAVLGDWLFKKESMGGGDIKLAAMLGAFLGWQKVLLVFLGSAVIGLVVSLLIMAFSARLRRTRIVPFGPFIALAAVMALIWGDRIVAFYIDNFLHLN